MNKCSPSTLNRSGSNGNLQGVKSFLRITLEPESYQFGAHVARAFFAGAERGELELIGFDALDFSRANTIMDRYSDVLLGIADTSIMALAARYRIQQILTLHRRHFSLVKPQALGYFNLLP